MPKAMDADRFVLMRSRIGCLSKGGNAVFRLRRAMVDAVQRSAGAAPLEATLGRLGVLQPFFDRICVCTARQLRDAP